MRAIDYPVAVDSDYGVWMAFANHDWPTLYFVDKEGVIRDQHFGEGRSEVRAVLQELLGVQRELVSVEGVGVEAEADWEHLLTPETYLGQDRSESYVSSIDQLRLNTWTLTGEWAIGRENVTLERPAAASPIGSRARRAPRAVARDHDPIPFRVLLDGQTPGASHGEDVDADGNGVLGDGRLYQLVRQHDGAAERTVEITFAEPGAQAYVFTFG